jgi:hypothetical protein
VQLPQDAAQDLAVVPPRLATPAVGRQQRSHTGERLVGELEHRACSWLVGSKSATLSSRNPNSSKVRL